MNYQNEKLSQLKTELQTLMYSSEQTAAENDMLHKDNEAKTKKIQDMLEALNDAQEKSSEIFVNLQRSIAEGKILAANL